MVLFYHNNYYIGFSQQKAYWFLVSLFLYSIFCNFFLNAKIFYSLIAFLTEQSWRNSFAMKRCGKWAYFFITKFTENWWNDCVFESTEEHRRCSGKVTDIRLASVEKFSPLWKDSSLHCASFRMTWLCFLLTIKNLNYFWNAKISLLFLCF